MLRPATTGLATAFFRLHLLDGLSSAPARPASLLTRVAAEKLPFASGAFSRALQSLLEGGYLVPARDGMVALTALGAAERVLVAYVRDRVAAAREGGRPFSVVLAVIGIEHANEPTRRAMLHRTIRASLGGASTLFGGDVTAFRYGEEGVSLVAARPEHQPLATLARARIDEVVRSMTSNVRAFHGARWRIHAGGATWSTELGTTGALLRAAEEALRADSEVLPAA